MDIINQGALGRWGHGKMSLRDLLNFWYHIPNLSGHIHDLSHCTADRSYYVPIPSIIR